MFIIYFNLQWHAEVWAHLVNVLLWTLNEVEDEII